MGTGNNIDKTEWFTKFDEWFELAKNSSIWKRYLKEVAFYELKALRNSEDQRALLSVMNNIWFELPDHIFNIKENPEHWDKFLNLIEE